MRILHVIPSLAERDGGPSKAVLEMCRELLRRGHHAEIYTTNADGDGCVAGPVGRTVSVRGVGVTYFNAVAGNYLKVCPTMARALATNVRTYDLLHIHALYQYPSSAGAYYGRKQHVPYVVTAHGVLDPYLYRRHRLRKWIYEVAAERRNLDRAACVHFASVEEMELAGTSGLRFRGAVIPHGVEAEEYIGVTREEADVIWPELAGRKVVLFLSRLNFKKGLDILAPAFGAIRRERPDAHLVIAGPDKDGYAAQVRGWLAEEGVLEATTFTGMVMGANKTALLKRADVFVLPSYSENFGIAVVEAMAAGLPVVISNRVNIWREIETAQAGLVVNPNAGEVARAMFTLLDYATLGKEMGARGRRLAREAFSWDVAGERLVRLYQSVIESRRPCDSDYLKRSCR